MVLREIPVTFATSDWPPRPIALASVAPHRRRVRSFIAGDKATNFSRRTATMPNRCMVQKYSGPRIVRVIYGRSLSQPRRTLLYRPWLLIWDQRPGYYFIEWWEGKSRRREMTGLTPSEATESQR